MMKKRMCEIKLYDKNDNCYIEAIFGINELGKILNSKIENTVSIEGDGKIKILSSNSKDVLEMLKNIGYNFDHIFEEKYGLKLMYEC